LNIPNC